VLRAVSGRRASARRARSAARPAAKNLKTAVLNAARRLCFAHGPDGVTARRIAAEVGCSATAIYLYYDSVDHVLHGLRLEGHTLLGEYLRRPPPALGAVERLTGMQQEYFRFAQEHPSYFSLMFLARFGDGPLLDVFRREGDTLMIVRDVAAEGIARGAIRADADPLLVANHVWLAVHGLAAAMVSGHLSVTAPERADALLERVVAATASWLRG